MKNRYKLLFLLFFTLILTGCTFKYDIKIMLNGKVVESAILFDGTTTIKDKKEFLSLVDKSLEVFDVKVDEKKNIYDGNLIGIKLQKNYSNLHDYARQNKAVKYIFENIAVSEENKIVNIKSISSQYDIIQNENNGSYNYTNSEITLTLPFKVIDSNANKVDAENNKYIWLVNDDFKEIKISYDKTKYYTNNIFKLFPYMTVDIWLTLLLIVIIIWFVISILILGFRLLKREKM